MTVSKEKIAKLANVLGQIDGVRVSETYNGDNRTLASILISYGNCNESYSRRFRKMATFVSRLARLYDELKIKPFGTPNISILWRGELEYGFPFIQLEMAQWDIDHIILGFTAVQAVFSRSNGHKPELRCREICGDNVP
ncbi:hypothetical protein ACFLUO_09410 [Chloroflexota bacterium]